MRHTISTTFLATVLGANAHAQTVDFSSTVSATGCTIMLINNGTLGLTNGDTRFSSMASGGTPGVIHVTNGGFARITAIPPQSTGWDITPSGSSLAFTNFTATISGVLIAGTGAASFPEVSGYTGANLGGNYVWPQGFGSGTTEVTVHLQADLTSGTFPNGAYQATVTTICE